MARNPFPGKTKDWLETKLADVDEALTATITSGSGGDSSHTSARIGDLRDMKQELLAALHVVDSENYPATDRIVTRTKADFS